MAEPTQIIFSHDTIGQLVIDNGIDDIQWTYGLNTQSFPTYGGEVVQILSVYIDDLKVMGTVTTYQQMEAIYKYFTSYLQVATQGKNATPNVGESTIGQAYNLLPVHFAYPARGWVFHLYPKSLPGFHYGLDVVAPTWEVDCFVVDDTPDMNIFLDGLKALHTANTAVPSGSESQVSPGDRSQLFSITGYISPKYGDPNANPFQTFDASEAEAQQQIASYANYYNSLITPWMSGDLSSLTAGIGSRPNVTPANASLSGTPTPTSGTVTVPGATH